MINKDIPPIFRKLRLISLLILLLLVAAQPAQQWLYNHSTEPNAILPAPSSPAEYTSAPQIMRLAYPPDPSSDIDWTGGTSSVADIQAAFNNARTQENSQLGKSIPMLTLPSQTAWNAMSDGERALWLINRERIDRGVMPLHGLEQNVTSVAQYYADYLLTNNTWGHNADGYSPWERLNNNPAIGACHDFLSVSENLAVFVTSGTSISIPIERSIYMWMYDDGSCCGWGHRHAILWYPYNDNSGTVGMEGFLGIGRANGGPYQGPFSQSWPFAEMIVMNVFDPCPTWDYSVPQVAGITRANPNPTSALNVQYTVTFTEPVSGVDRTDFVLTANGVTGASVLTVSGSGNTYFVTIHTGFSNGTLRLDLQDNDSIVDASNTPLGGLGSGNGNFTAGEEYTVSKTLNTRISIGTSSTDYHIPSQEVAFLTFPSTLAGPVKVISANGEPIFTTQVVTSGGSYNELAGFPVNQFTTEYWFPYYDHGYPNVTGSKMRTWILVGNPSTTQTAEVEIYIGGVLKGSYSIAPGANVTPRWIGVVGGPVRVVSTNGVNIFASERVFTVPYNSFNEVMGYPANQFTTEYWFPWYDTVYMDTYVLVGNTSSSQSASVDIYIGATKMGSYSIAPNATLKQRYAAKVGGPLRVVSTNGVNIVASEYTLSGTQNSFNEVMGYPFNQFTTE
ncbi:MAG: hypothetical protein HY780_02830, partial [Chloroflexi bacterium]|nr:hypothetical protein [Chloroflexota bacterium]